MEAPKDDHRGLPPPHPELGNALRELAADRGLSQKRLARISGVSRRHVALAFDGGNITVTILKKLMRALQADSVPLGDAGTITAHSEGVNNTVLLMLAEQVEQGVTVAAGAAASLRTYALSGGKSVAMNAKAAALVREFTTYIQTVTDAGRLAELECAMSEALRAEDPARDPARPDNASNRAKQRTA